MIEYVLFFVSGFNMLYYGALILLTDCIWRDHLYWPISAVVFLILGIILWEDSREWKTMRTGMPIRVRAVIAYTCGLYLFCLCAFVIMLIVAKYYKSEEQWDYLILVESSGQTDALTNEDLFMLNAALEYLEKPGHSSTKLVLAAYNLQDEEGEYSEEIQYLMQDYLMEQGVLKDKMIIRKISNSLRKNIRNSYAYALVDWFQTDMGEVSFPNVAIMASELSCLRYYMMLHNLGYHFAVFDYPEDWIYWPSRFMTELVETIRCHMNNQFIYD